MSENFKLFKKVQLKTNCFEGDQGKFDSFLFSFKSLVGEYLKLIYDKKLPHKLYISSSQLPDSKITKSSAWKQCAYRNASRIYGEHLDKGVKNLEWMKYGLGNLTIDAELFNLQFQNTKKHNFTENHTEVIKDYVLSDGKKHKFECVVKLKLLQFNNNKKHLQTIKLPYHTHTFLHKYLNSEKYKLQKFISFSKKKGVVYLNLFFKFDNSFHDFNDTVKKYLNSTTKNHDYWKKNNGEIAAFKNTKECQSDLRAHETFTLTSVEKHLKAETLRILKNEELEEKEEIQNEFLNYRSKLQCKNCQKQQIIFLLKHNDSNISIEEIKNLEEFKNYKTQHCPIKNKCELLKSKIKELNKLKKEYKKYKEKLCKELPFEHFITKRNIDIKNLNHYENELLYKSEFELKPLLEEYKKSKQFKLMYEDEKRTNLFNKILKLRYQIKNNFNVTDVAKLAVRKTSIDISIKDARNANSLGKKWQRNLNGIRKVTEGHTVLLFKKLLENISWGGLTEVINDFEGRVSQMNVYQKLIIGMLREKGILVSRFKGSKVCRCCGNDTFIVKNGSRVCKSCFHKEDMNVHASMKITNVTGNAKYKNRFNENIIVKEFVVGNEDQKIPFEFVSGKGTNLHNNYCCDVHRSV